MYVCTHSYKVCTYVQCNHNLGTKEMIQLREISGLDRFYMYRKYYRAGLENASSLERVPDYRGFGLQRGFAAHTVCVVHTYILYSFVACIHSMWCMYILRTCSETSLNRSICNLEPSLNWVCFKSCSLYLLYI